MLIDDKTRFDSEPIRYQHYKFPKIKSKERDEDSSSEGSSDGVVVSRLKKTKGSCSRVIDDLTPKILTIVKTHKDNMNLDEGSSDQGSKKFDIFASSKVKETASNKGKGVSEICASAHVCLEGLWSAWQDKLKAVRTSLQAVNQQVATVQCPRDPKYYTKMLVDLKTRNTRKEFIRSLKDISGIRRVMRRRHEKVKNEHMYKNRKMEVLCYNDGSCKFRPFHEFKLINALEIYRDSRLKMKKRPLIKTGGSTDQETVSAPDKGKGKQNKAGDTKGNKGESKGGDAKGARKSKGGDAKRATAQKKFDSKLSQSKQSVQLKA